MTLECLFNSGRFYARSKIHELEYYFDADWEGFHIDCVRGLTYEEKGLPYIVNKVIESSDYYESAYICPCCADKEIVIDGDSVVSRLWKLKLERTLSFFEGNHVELYNLFTCCNCNRFFASLRAWNGKSIIGRNTHMPPALQDFALFSKPYSDEEWMELISLSQNLPTAISAIGGNKSIDEFMEDFVNIEYPGSSYISIFDLVSTVEKLNWKAFDFLERESELIAYLERRAPKETRVGKVDMAPEEQDEERQMENVIRTVHNYVLLNASQQGDVMLAKAALKKGADPDEACLIWNERTFPLIEAALRGHVAIVQVLLDAGANVNIQKRNGESPLADASCYDHYVVAKILLENGANPNIVATQGLTPLTQVENVEMVELLLQYGADPNIPDSDGDLPIVYRIDNGDKASVIALIKAGTNLDHENKKGRSARASAQSMVGDMSLL